MADGTQRLSTLSFFADTQMTSKKQAVDFSQVYRAHRLSIYRYALARTGNIDDAARCERDSF